MAKIFESEYRFCLIMWEHEPINSTCLVKLCKEKLGWSKATTYTVIRRLAERGILQNVDATVSALITKEQAQLEQMEEMMEKTFENSVPAFIAAFAHTGRLSEKEVKQLEAMIENYSDEH